MTDPKAPGERFLATNKFLWMAEISKLLRDRLGARAAKVPTRRLPGFALRLMAVFDRALRYVTPNIGRSNSFTSAKAQRLLGWAPRPVETTIVECAESLIEKGAL
jgi:hypothetical protein